MSAIPLPTGLEEKIDDLAVEIRRLRVLRGVCWFAVVLFALPFVAVGLDWVFTLSGPARGAVLAGGVAVAVFSFWWLILRRIRGEVPPAELAVAIEQEYPNLAERLRTLVELSEQAEPGNGSKAMVALLARETEKRAKKMNFLKVAPTGLTLRLASFAIIAGTLAISPLFLVPGAGERIRRLFLPWYQPPVDVPYAITVSSGNPVVKRGEPVTLSAFLERTKPTGDLPTAATLVYRSPGGASEKRLPMSGDDKAAFTVTRPNVTADFEYRVECGPAASEWYTVSAVDPVEVIDGTTIAISAPEYARAIVTEQKKDGVGEVEALQHSVAAFQFRLSRVPADAHLEFRPADPKAGATPINLNPKLQYSGDRRTVSCTLSLTTDGVLKLTLFGDKSVRTEVPIAVRAWPDHPPRFEKVVGVPSEVREVKPDAVLTFDLAVTDDIGVGKAFVDFAPIDAPPEQFTSEPLTLPTGGPRSEGKVRFALANRVKLGEAIRLRIRVQDNRSLPELGVGPNESIYPDKDRGWAALRVVENAKPLAEQDIVSQKQTTAARLDDIAKLVKASADDVSKLMPKVKGTPEITQDQATDISLDKERVQRAARLLTELARDNELQPDLRPLANTAREIAADPLAIAEDELRKVGTEKDPKPRDEAFALADQALKDAIEKLARLRQANEEIGNSRLDRSKIDDLTAEQQKLAEDAAKADPAQTRELEQKQKELNEKLKQLVDESDALKKTRADAEQKRAENLADELSKLADRQRDLDDAINKTADAAKREQLDELRKLQKKLNDQAAALRKKTETPARLSDTKPLDKQPFDQAAEQLDRKNAMDAMTEQEKAARDLDRLADALADKVKARGDTKAAAEQIARWQNDLNRRAVDAAKQNPNGIPKPESDALAAEQTAIQKATDRLALPKDESLERTRTDASKKANDAAQKLRNDPNNAAAAGRKAADALDELAKKTKSNKERNTEAKKELEKLRREQEQIQQEAEDAARAVKQNPDDKTTRDELAKKLAENADKQDELTKKVKELDTPGQEARRDRTAAAGERAAEDMRNGLSQDVPTSQADVKRQIDRLRDALDGKTPVDEKAAELARLQKDLTRNLEGAPKPEDLQRLQRQQQDLSRQVSQLTAPEAPGQLADAQAAAKAAERAASKPMPDVDELKKKSKEASEALDKLADRLSGDESPEKRLERLAKNRQVEADKAKAAENTLSDLNRAREAQRQAERDQNELGDTRTGAAQAAKKKLQDVLDKLANANEPDKAKDLQQQAADAAKRLGDAVKKNGDRMNGDARTPKPNPDPADSTDAANGLPTERDVQQARDLAKQQRELRNDVAKAQERSAKGMPPTPPGQDPLNDLAKEQAEIAKQAGDLAEQAKNDGDPSSEAAADGAKQAQQATEKLKAGDPKDAQKAGRDAGQKLRDAANAAQNPDMKKKANELVQRQDELNQKAEQTDAAAAVGRQRNRQGELADEARKLGDELVKASQQVDPQSKTAKNLDAAADATKKATEQMNQADRQAKSGKMAEAADSRRQAERNLDDAARMARGGENRPDTSSPPKPSTRNPTQDAANALSLASQKQQEAQGQMSQGDAKGAARAAKQAADQMKRASDQLSKAEQGEGNNPSDPKPGDGQGNTPGMKSGAGKPSEIPSVVLENLGKSWGDLPGEVKSKITAELKAKYGEDYARVIKLYFEQLAEKK
jgi:hypothetical protein